MFKKYVFLKLIISILFICLIANCNAKKDSLLGMDTTTSTDNTDTTKFHAPGWALVTAHGAESLKGFAGCKSCHGKDYKGGKTNVSCYTCHKGAGPDHPESTWIGKHKTIALSNMNLCKKCHGTNYSGGATAIPCVKCHMENETKVHMIAWDTVKFDHGSYAKTDTTKCARIYCHGSDLKGVDNSGDSCDKCHTWPISSKHHVITDWSLGINHGSAAKSDSTACKNACHGTDFKGGTSNVSCYNCHTWAYHTSSTWKLGTSHGITAELDFTACKTACHGTNYKGGTSGSSNSCYKCHSGPGLDHPNSTYILSNHKTNALANINGCKKCHGNDDLGGGSKIACNSCHLENGTKVHIISWYNTSVDSTHGAYESTNGITKCNNIYCHNLHSGGATTYTGPACNSCHERLSNITECKGCHHS